MHIVNEYMPGAARTTDPVHPFRKYFDDLSVGDALVTATYGDGSGHRQLRRHQRRLFYAHMDDIAARDSLFEKRVAHGYSCCPRRPVCSSTRRRGPCWPTMGSKVFGS